MDPEEIRWSAPEFQYYEKDIGWYWMSLIVAAALIVFALWRENYMFAIFLGLAESLIIFWGRRQPRTLDFELSHKGLHIEKVKFYPFKKLSAFAIIDDPHGNPSLKELVLKSKGLTQGAIKVTIAAERAPAVRALAEQFLPEFEYEESITEHLGRLFRF